MSGFVKNFLVLTAILAFSTSAYARMGILASEVDNNPDKVYAIEVEFPNGTLSCTGGVCTYTPTGAAEVVDAAVGDAGNADTTHAYSKDDIRDYVYTADPDFDGLPSVLDTAVTGPTSISFGSNYADNGSLRLPNSAELNWRNNGNDGNLGMYINEGDNLMIFGGRLALASTGTGDPALTVPAGSIDYDELTDGACLAEIADDDGTGSGLDADLLDGQHGSYYEPALTDEASLYSTLSDVSQFYEPGDTIQGNSGTSLPGTCTVGEMFTDTDADTNGSLYICVSENTWKEVDDDGGAGGGGDLLADGTVPLTANWDAGSYKITAQQFESDVATGTAPLIVASTTQVANLNAATAGNSTTVTLTDNENTNENNPIWFSAGAAGSGSVGAEADGDLYYNPSTGVIYSAGGFLNAETADPSVVFNSSGTQYLYIQSDNGDNIELSTDNTAGSNVFASIDVDDGDFHFLKDTVQLLFGADGDVSLTHVADTGLLFNAAMQFQFRDSAIYINSGADGYLDLEADTGIRFNGPVSFANEGDIDLPANSVDAADIATMNAYANIPVAWMKDGTSAPDDIDDGSTRSPYAYRTFANDSTEDLNFVWFVPSDLSGSAIQFRVKYLVTNATGPSSEGVAFALSGVSLGDNDATNGAKGTAVVVTDTGITAAQHDVLITGWSGDVTITNLAAGEVAELNFARDHDDASDDYGQVVGVIAVELRYTKNPA